MLIITVHNVLLIVKPVIKIKFVLLVELDCIYKEENVFNNVILLSTYQQMELANPVPVHVPMVVSVKTNVKPVLMLLFLIYSEEFVLKNVLMDII